MSASSIGMFVGPIVGGIVVEISSFRYATLVFFIGYWITLSLNCISAMNAGVKFQCPSQIRKRHEENMENTEMITNED